MAKHLLEDDQDTKYGKIIARQGVRLVYLEKHAKELENNLIQERIDRIEDLKTIKSWATSNCYNNEKATLRKVAEIATDKIKKLTNVNTNKKELSSHTDQSI